MSYEETYRECLSLMVPDYSSLQPVSKLFIQSLVEAKVNLMLAELAHDRCFDL